MSHQQKKKWLLPPVRSLNPLPFFCNVTAPFDFMPPASVSDERLHLALADVNEVLRLSPEFQAHGHFPVQVNLGCRVAHGQGYLLEVLRDEIRLFAADEVGIFYAMQTLRQWLLIHTSSLPVLPCVRIEDWPDLDQRGFMLDISRNKVPHMATFFGIVDWLAHHKMNQFQLYMEHTFAYEGHHIVWQDVSPMTAEDVKTLDTYCQQRFIQLVPNQNSFGHMHQWLRHEAYRHLAECPDGISHPFSHQVEPFSLCPIDPASTRFLADLYAQLLPHFRSKMFNVGLDEALDLGWGRSKAACEQQGRGAVYVAFLRNIHDLAAAHGKTIQFWADIVLSYPDLLSELPKDSISLVWSYEHNHPIENDCARMAQTGLDFYVCPGTSSWNSIAGRTKNAVANIGLAAWYGFQHGAKGLLLTDWGDRGHWQPLTASYPGLIAAASFSWAAESGRNFAQLPLANLLDLWVFGDQANKAGRTLVSLGNAYSHVGVFFKNTSVLFELLQLPDAALSHERLFGLDEAKLLSTKQKIIYAMERIGFALLSSPNRHTYIRELEWAGDMLALACDVGLCRLRHDGYPSLSHVPDVERRPLAHRLEDLIQTFRQLWHGRYRPGGLTSSLALFEPLRKALGPTHTTDL